MASGKFKLLEAEEFIRSKARRRPRGYVVFVRDVSYGNRYMLVWVHDPQSFRVKYLKQAFETEIALVYEAGDAVGLSRELLKTYAGGAGQGDWFDLSAAKLLELQDLPNAPERFSTTAARLVGLPDSRRLGELLQGQGARRGATRTPAPPPSRPRPPRPAPAPARAASSPSPSPQAATARSGGSVRRRLLYVMLLALVAGALYGQATGRDPLADVVSLVGDGIATLQSPASLARPRIVEAKATATGAHFRWRSVAGTIAYRYRFKVNGGEFAPWRSTTRLRVDLRELAAGDRVSFELVAARGGQLSALSRAKVTLPEANATSTKTNAPVPSATNTLTHTPQPSATNTFTPWPEPSARIMVVETQDELGANVRACPERRCGIVAVLRPGDEIQALERVSGEFVLGSDAWIRFEREGGGAYIHSALVASTE